MNDRPVLLFDGVCNLCNGAVTFVIRRDPRAQLRFAALQSPAAEALLASLGVARAGLPDSFVLVEDGRVHLRSTAALRVARRLRFPWPLLAVLLVVPRFLRDPLYDLVARHRYRWFGQREECMVPTAALRERFLSDSRVSADRSGA